MSCITEKVNGPSNVAKPPPDACHPLLTFPSKATCEAPSGAVRNLILQRSKRAYSNTEKVHMRMRNNQALFLMERDKNMEKEQAILEEKQAAKEAERVKLLASLETESQLRMQKARVHLRRLLLTRRDGT